jgi:hypothetical protein
MGERVDFESSRDNTQRRNELPPTKWFSIFKRLLSARLKPKFALPRAVGVNPTRILDIGIANDSYVECKAHLSARRVSWS